MLIKPKEKSELYLNYIYIHYMYTLYIYYTILCIHYTPYIHILYIHTHYTTTTLLPQYIHTTLLLQYTVYTYTTTTTLYLDFMLKHANQCLGCRSFILHINSLQALFHLADLLLK